MNATVDYYGLEREPVAHEVGSHFEGKSNVSLQFV